MEIFLFLKTTGGLAFLHFTQTILFSMMVYILVAEYIRTKRDDLIYKMVACVSITVSNIITTGLLMLEHFYAIVPSEKVIPLLLNSVFAVIVIALARAFVYSHVENKKQFDSFVRKGMLVVGVIYVVMQTYWLYVFEPGMVFMKSRLSLIFIIYFIAMLIFSIYSIVRFRSDYRARLIAAFSSILAAQLVNLYGAVFQELPGGLMVLRSTAPLLVPVMFGSVVFKELIESVVVMVDHLKRVLDNQRDLVFSLMKTGAELSLLSDDLVKTSLEGWQKLSGVVESIYAQENDRQNLMDITDNTINEIESLTEKLEQKQDEKSEIISSYEKGEVELDSEKSAVSRSIASMEEFFAAFKESAGKTSGILEGLKAAAGRIEASLKDIEEISDKTNMLALNASIEAARAGEQGRGFAVVAGEVRNLAQRSGNAAKEIGDLIKNSVEKIELGTEKANKSGEALTEIIESVKNVGNVISEIAAASNEQKQGINQINIAVTEMDTMTQQNAALVEETASASEEMANQAQELMAMMQNFQVRDEYKSSMAGRQKQKQIHLKAAEAQREAGKASVDANKSAKPAQQQTQKAGTQQAGSDMKNLMSDEGFEEF